MDLKKAVLPFKGSLLIVPTFNEKENVGNMIRAVFGLYPDISLLIVDDNSPDNTACAVKAHQKKFPHNLFLLEREKKNGLGKAYTTGFKWALDRNFNYIFTMDCDFSHDPKDIKHLLTEALKNDLVIGSRYIGGIRIINWPFHRLFLSYCASIYIRTITRIPIFDTTGGFRCYTSKALLGLDLNNILSDGYIFHMELSYKIWSQGMNIKEVPIIFHERQKGESKMEWAIIIEAFFNVLKLYIKNFMGRLSR